MQLFRILALLILNLVHRARCSSADLDEGTCEESPEVGMAMIQKLAPAGGMASIPEDAASLRDERLHSMELPTEQRNDEADRKKVTALLAERQSRNSRWPFQMDSIHERFAEEGRRVASAWAQVGPKLAEVLYKMPRFASESVPTPVLQDKESVPTPMPFSEGSSYLQSQYSSAQPDSPMPSPTADPSSESDPSQSPHFPAEGLLEEDQKPKKGKRKGKRERKEKKKGESSEEEDDAGVMTVQTTTTAPEIDQPEPWKPVKVYHPEPVKIPEPETEKTIDPPEKTIDPVDPVPPMKPQTKPFKVGQAPMQKIPEPETEKTIDPPEIDPVPPLKPQTRPFKVGQAPMQKIPEPETEKTIDPPEKTIDPLPPMKPLTRPFKVGQAPSQQISEPRTEKTIDPMPPMPVDPVPQLKPQTRPFKVGQSPSQQISVPKTEKTIDPMPQKELRTFKPIQAPLEKIPEPKTEKTIDPMPPMPVDPVPQLKPQTRPFKVGQAPMQKILEPETEKTIDPVPVDPVPQLKPQTRPFKVGQAPTQQISEPKTEKTIDPVPDLQKDIPQKELRTFKPLQVGQAPMKKISEPRTEKTIEWEKEHEQPLIMPRQIKPQEQVVGSDGAVTKTTKKCFNWFGMHFDPTKIPTATYTIGKPWGEMRSNICNAGLTKPYGAFSCWAQTPEGKLKPCGLNVNCIAGVCVKEQNLQYTWGKVEANRQCKGNLLDELAGDPQDHSVTDCKILCESMNTCTGFNEGKAKCSLFSSVTSATNCDSDPEYKVHFVTRTSR